MTMAWENTVDGGRFLCGVVQDENDGYSGRLQVKVVETGEMLLDEEVGISYAARFGPDMDDVRVWQERCIGIIDEWLEQQ